jgi:hypothetical protein
MFTARAERTRSSRSSHGSSRALAARAMIASTVPVEIRDAKSCSHSSTTSRRLMRWVCPIFCVRSG